jgi:hypothetical protein
MAEEMSPLVVILKYGPAEAQFCKLVTICGRDPAIVSGVRRQRHILGVQHRDADAAILFRPEHIEKIIGCICRIADGDSASDGETVVSVRGRSGASPTFDPGDVLPPPAD